MKNTKTLQTGEPASASGQSRTNLPHRILVVDDDSGVRQLSAEVLSCSGYQVDTAADGVAAWEALHAKSYDLLITDINMPKVSGLELVEKLRAAEVTLPAIVVSAEIPMEAIRRQPWLQIEAALLKPFTIAELLGTVKAALRRPAGEASQT